MPRIFTVILFIFCINCLSAQQKEVVRSIFWKGDTLPHVWLEEVSVRQKIKMPAGFSVSTGGKPGWNIMSGKYIPMPG